MNQFDVEFARFARMIVTPVGPRCNEGGVVKTLSADTDSGSTEPKSSEREVNPDSTEMPLYDSFAANLPFGGVAWQSSGSIRPGP